MVHLLYTLRTSMALPAAEAVQHAAAAALQGQRGRMRTHGQRQSVQEPGLARSNVFPQIMGIAPTKKRVDWLKSPSKLFVVG